MDMLYSKLSLIIRLTIHCLKEDAHEIGLNLYSVLEKISYPFGKILKGQGKSKTDFHLNDIP